MASLGSAKPALKVPSGPGGDGIAATRCMSRPASTTRPPTPGARPSQRPATRARSRPPGAATTSNPSRTKFTGATLLCAATGKDRGNGQDEDLEVEPGRPILHVIVVPLDPVGKRYVPAQP